MDRWMYVCIYVCMYAAGYIDTRPRLCSGPKDLTSFWYRKLGVDKVWRDDMSGLIG